MYNFPPQRLCTNTCSGKANDIFPQMDNYTGACIRQSRSCDVFALTCSWRMNPHRPPHMSSCGLCPSRDVTVLRKNHTQLLTFPSLSATPQKMPPIFLFMTSIYKSTGASLHSGSRFPSDTMHPDSGGSVPGQACREGLSGFIRFEHRLTGCYCCLHVCEH